MMDDTNQSNVINLSDRQRAAEELLRAKDNDRIAAQAIKDKAKAQREQDRLQREQDKLQQRAELKAAKLAADIEAREAETIRKTEDANEVMAKYGEQFYFMMTSNAYLQVVDGTLHFFKSQAIKEVEAGFADKEWSNIWKAGSAEPSVSRHRV